jgi:hypothetical protein
MQRSATRWCAALCSLLIAAQAVLPRDLVCCMQAGGAALELAHHGHCLGYAADAPGHSGETGCGQASGPQLAGQFVASGCHDLPILTAEARTVRSDELAVAPLAAPGPARLELHCHAAIPVPQPLARRPHAPPDSGWPALVAGCSLVLRI